MRPKLATYLKITLSLNAKGGRYMFPRERVFLKMHKSIGGSLKMKSDNLFAFDFETKERNLR